MNIFKELADKHIFFRVIVDHACYKEDYEDSDIVYIDDTNRGFDDKVKFFFNQELLSSIPVKEFLKYRELLWELVGSNAESVLTIGEVGKLFGAESDNTLNNSELINLLDGLTNGKVKILIETKDIADTSVVFEIWNISDSSSTLLNASGDNTNFVYEVVGPMDDEKMEHFNNLFKEVKRKGKVCYDIATNDRMQYLHKIGCDIRFFDTAKQLAKTNLIKCGGMEMPAIVAGMLKEFYFENLSGPTSMEDCIKYLADNDVAGYGFDDLEETYHSKIAQLLLCTFTGMRLGSPWNGRQAVNGGYIVVKNNGDVVAFHSTIADEFKDFLVAKMLMESPSHSRHKDMVIYKEGDRYFLKLALQLRFTLGR